MLLFALSHCTLLVVLCCLHEGPHAIGQVCLFAIVSKQFTPGT